VKSPEGHPPLLGHFEITCFLASTAQPRLFTLFFLTVARLRRHALLTRIYTMDEGRPRVLAIVLVARHLKTVDDLSDQASLSGSVFAQERILWPKSKKKFCACS